MVPGKVWGRAGQRKWPRNLPCPHEVRADQSGRSRDFVELEQVLSHGHAPPREIPSEGLGLRGLQRRLRVVGPVAEGWKQ